MAMAFTYDHGYDFRSIAPGCIRQVICTWTSDGSGDASGTTDKIVGELMKGVTNPGTAAPTADYDITLTDDDGADLLGNSFDDLVDRHTSNTESVDFFLNDGTTSNGARPCVCGPITVTVANAGASKEGVLRLFYKVS